MTSPSHSAKLNLALVCPFIRLNVLIEFDYLDCIGSKLVTVTARKEVILSAGTVNTTHVLLNSGIGDEAELRTIGIHAVLNLPSVGKNMSDHPMVTADYNVNSNDTFDE